jgi:hypothetical protein
VAIHWPGSGSKRVVVASIVRRVTGCELKYKERTTCSELGMRVVGCGTWFIPHPTTQISNSDQIVFPLPFSYFSPSRSAFRNPYNIFRTVIVSALNESNVDIGIV